MIAAGTRLGPYEVIAPIGAGGMGEVFKARDTRLDRSVAIKILPAEFAQNAQLKLRFQREARTISQLNHPNICTLYDVGDDYLVMELLEGETLADRLAKGPLPLDQQLRYGIEIAEALEKAHKAGVVHRDLKPGNIMLTKSGAKLLDFGLAKTHAPIDIEGPTQHKPLTQEGTILGTFQYMAPEQIEGATADARTDIFALGTVLYEMATGKRAFEGKSKASLISSILTAEPQPINAIQPASPRSLDHVIRTCLKKDPDERWQSAHDVAEELRWVPEGEPRVASARNRKREAIPWILALLLAAVAAALWFRPSRPVSDARLMRFEIQPPQNAAFNFAGRDAGPVAVSPNGAYFAFVATTTEGAKRLYVRRIDAISAQALPGTEGASYPFWSADSENLGFFAEGKLKRIPAAGGAVRTLCDASAGRGGAWNLDGTIIFTPSPYDPVYKVSANGGQVLRLTELTPSAHEYSHRWPAFLPDGRHFLYMQFSGIVQAAGQTIRMATLDKPQGTTLLQANSQTIYVEPGYVIYIRDSNLMAMPFSASELRPTGDLIEIAEHVQTYPNTASGVFSASNTGVVAYQPAGNAPISHLIWFDRQGKTLSVIGQPDDYEDPKLSPEGRRVALTRRDPDTGISNIWIYEVATGTPTRFSYVPTFDHIPCWSPDGKQIVFDSNRNGAADVYIKHFGEDERLLYQSPVADQPTDWSPDGRFIVFQSQDPKTKWDLWILNTGDHRATPLLRGPFNEKDGQVSPDGTWIAYTSDESGRPEVYVSRFPAGSGRWQISSSGGGGSQPRWRRDGREIFFLSTDRKMMAAAVQGNKDDFIASPPKSLFQTRARYTGDRAYDVSADGQRFLINTMLFGQPSSPVMAVVNWRRTSGTK